MMKSFTSIKQWMFSVLSGSISNTGCELLFFYISRDMLNAKTKYPIIILLLQIMFSLAAERYSSLGCIPKLLNQLFVL